MSAPVPCGWCGLRVATVEVYATPTCHSCAKGGRIERIKQSLKRWARRKGLVAA